MTSSSSLLEYPFSQAPAPGEVSEITPGLYWVRLPLPFRLNHVNIWLLKEDNGWTVIDTGCATKPIFDAWETLLSGPMKGEPVRRLIATHGHVDHIGLAGWLVERFGAEFVGTFAEWVWARLSHTNDVPGSDFEHHRFLLRHGFDEISAERMVKSRHRFIAMSTAVPGAITEIRDGETIRFGGRDWKIIVTGGHAFEHSSFYCAVDNILIAGDHLLPKISPVIAVYEMIPKADPLRDYLESFSQFTDIPSDVLVLPSHGMPYYGMHARVDELRDHHEERLSTTVNLLRESKNALDLSRAMFPHITGLDDIGFALGEVIAHVNYLVNKGAVTENTDQDGHVMYAASR